MMGFSNPIIGGAATLIRAAMQSANFLTGVAGWQVTKTGNAEFNNLTIRGTFLGTNFIFSSAGLFLYSGTPAAGNLIFSITPAATTADSFGNTVPNAGGTSYINDGAFWSAVNLGDGEIQWFKASAPSGAWTVESAIGFSFNNITGGGLILTAPAGIGGSVSIPQFTPSILNLPNDPNSGTTWVSGERAFMNNNWVANVNSNFNAIVSALQAAGIFN